MINDDTHSGRFAAWANTYIWPPYCKLAAILVVGGLGLSVVSDAGGVSTIRVTKHGLMPDVVDQPDFYIILSTNEGDLQSGAYQDTPIGNGLEWKLPESMRLADLYEVQLVDSDLLMDDQLDRVTVNGRKCVGQSYTFEFIGSASILGNLALVALATGGGYLIYALGRFIRDQAL